MVAYSDKTKEYRYFALHKLSDVQLTDNIFRKDESFSLEDFTWDGEGSWIYAYLLMNPRREVVEWTLEHKDIFEFGEWDIKLALDHQVIPELRTLIENELKQ